MTTDSTARHLTRREALGSAAALCGLAVLASGLTQGQAHARVLPSAETLPDGRVKVPLAELSRVGAVVVIDVRGERTAVVRVSRSTYRALVLVCTHQGAPVNPSGKGFACSDASQGHRSRFRRNGSVESGPAYGPLERLPLRKDGTSLIVG